MILLPRPMVAGRRRGALLALHPVPVAASACAAPPDDDVAVVKHKQRRKPRVCASGLLDPLYKAVVLMIPTAAARDLRRTSNPHAVWRCCPGSGQERDLVPIS